MENPSRIRVSPDGSLRLPGELTEKLGWTTGSYLEVLVEGDTLRLRRIEVDPFAEALKKPDAGMFEKLLEKQKKSQEDAARIFEEKIRKGDSLEIRPEDKPDYWR
jgi:bifunctional DNA-binding transcriptional regulator/antitoxin component of YhaV-PrlF toxin-antitoxin module